MERRFLVAAACLLLTAAVDKAEHVVLLADVFNLFNQQRALDYDPDTQTSFPVLNPDFGQPSRANLAQLQTRRQVRLGIRFDF
jgi:hypothetical protein